jgi:hypothetical protein
MMRMNGFPDAFIAALNKNSAVCDIRRSFRSTVAGNLSFGCYEVNSGERPGDARQFCVSGPVIATGRVPGRALDEWCRDLDLVSNDDLRRKSQHVAIAGEQDVEDERGGRNPSPPSASSGPLPRRKKGLAAEAARQQASNRRCKQAQFDYTARSAANAADLTRPVCSGGPLPFQGP